MNNKHLIERKENIFSKIRNFFRGLFFKKEKYNYSVPVSQNIEQINNNNKEKYETDKKEFMELYERVKNGEIDLFSIPIETLKKICALLEEEIKLEEKHTELLREKLNSY